MLAVKTVLSLFIIILKLTEANNVLRPTITISKGSVQGTRNETATQNKTYWAFRGIPFAQPPTGELRFKPPLPVNPWNNTLQATQDRSPCVQDDGSGTEDCLYLSIYTTNLESNKALPVMLWIYGGAFTEGYGALYHPDFFLDADVIVVLINYRLGIFGFLSTGDLVAPGNNGLRDQILALKFVKENIKYFGGDTNKITIFGESAGAASVSYLLQSPLTYNLYQGAIMESGTSLCLWSLKRDARRLAFAVGTALGINTNNSKILIQELRKTNYQMLQRTSTLLGNIEQTLTTLLDGLSYAPVIEPDHKDAVVTGRSYELLKQGKFNKVPLIIGFNSEEFNFIFNNTSLELLRLYYLLIYDLNEDKVIPIDMNLNASDNAVVANKVKNYYWGTSRISVNLSRTDRFLSDTTFDRPVRETVKLMSEYTSEVYYYRFSCVGLLSEQKANLPGPGAGHSDELYYLWFFNRNASQTDKVVRSRMLKLWTNFSKFKNPTPSKDPLFGNINWPVTRQTKSSDNLTFLDIGQELQVKVNPNYKNLKFWSDLYKTYGNPPYDTY